MTSSVLALPTQALRQPRRIDWRALFGLFLLLLATGGSVAFWSASSDTRAVVVATRDLPAGSTLSATDLAVARVRVDDTIYHAAVPGEELAGLVGRELAHPLHAHQVLARGQLSTGPQLESGQLALTIAISPERAVGGQLRPGDAVQVLLTTNKGTSEARTTVVLLRVTVYDVGYERGLAAIGTEAAERSTRGPARWLTLIVDRGQALELARAKWAGELDVALLPAEAQ